MFQFIVKDFEPQYLDEVIEILHRSFLPDENICKCVKLIEDSPIIAKPPESRYLVTKAAKELEDLTRDMIKDGLSVVAVNESTNKVAGFAINKLQRKGATYFDDFKKNFKEDQTLKVMDFIIEVDEQFDLFDYYKANCCIELCFLSVANEARGHSLGRKLIEETIKKTEKHPDAQFICAIFTSKYSQRCGTLGGMEIVMEYPYNRFSYKGRLFSEEIGEETPYATLSAKKNLLIN